MPFIDVIEPEDATGELKAIYESLGASRGKIASVHKIQSLNAPTIPAHMELYKQIMFARSPLTRAEREMIAVVVSSENGCAYCIRHHAEALAHFWERERAELLAAGGLDALARSDDGVSERERALCAGAAALTRDPASAALEGAWVEPMRDLGFSDREVLDLTLVVAYFNFVNRVVLGLGVELEESPGGYRYE